MYVCVGGGEAVSVYLSAAQRAAQSHGDDLVSVYALVSQCQCLRKLSL